MIDLSPLFKDLNSLISVVQVVITMLLTELAKRKITLSDTAMVNFKQATAWIISLTLSSVGYFSHLGMFSQMTLPTSLLYGLILGLASNGIFDINLINNLLTKKEAK